MRRRVTYTVIAMTILCPTQFSRLDLGASEASHRVHATVLRRESSIRTSLSNRDVYLIQVVPKSGKAFVARMIDEYPPYADTLPDFVVGDEEKFSVALRRTPYCDEPMGQTNPTGAEPSVRCFAVVHDSWKINDPVRDQWWK